MKPPVHLRSGVGKLYRSWGSHIETAECWRIAWHCPENCGIIWALNGFDPCLPRTPRGTLPGPALALLFRKCRAVGTNLEMTGVKECGVTAVVMLSYENTLRYTLISLMSSMATWSVMVLQTGPDMS